MITIEATVPVLKMPAWAVLERKLMEVMDQSVYPFLEKYTHADGRLIWQEGRHHSRDGADDFYESFYNWPLLYLLGGEDHMLELGSRQWDATTRLLEELGHVHKEYERGYDQFHQSEGYIYFYLLCMADPQDDRQGERARRFAGFYLNEDPEALNYDPEKKLIRAPHNGSGGPRWGFSDVATPSYGYSPNMAAYGLPYEDVPGVTGVEDLKDPELARRMGEAMQARMGRGDVAANLGVISLITNAWLLTGEGKYRNWVLEYVGAWMERARQNGGLLPDNVGLSGAIGEYINGKWYGGLYGWTWPHGFYNIAMAAIVAGMSAYLMTRDERYLELPRTQIQSIIEQGMRRDVRELQMSLKDHWTDQLTVMGASYKTFVVPYRYGDSGWFDYQPLSPIFPLALWNLAMDPADWDIIERIRREENYDWRKVTPSRGKEDAGHEQPWLCYLLGENPDYPEKILQESLAQVYRRLDQIREDQTDPTQNHIHHWQQLNPVLTEALIQLTLGAPQIIYNGGLLIAPVRYFDAERRRPGLPEDVAALVEKVEKDRMVLNLVNLSGFAAREMIVQAGSLGEHQFTEVLYSARTSVYPGKVGTYTAPALQTETQKVTLNASYMQVRLPPGTKIRLDLGMARFVRDPSYAFPWHDDRRSIG